MKKALIGLISLLFFSLIPQAYAIDFTQFDDQLGAFIGADSFAGGLLATIILFFIIYGTTSIVSRKKPAFIFTFLMGICILGFSIAIGWLPYWLLLIIVVGVAALWSAKTRNWISG